MFEPRVQEFHWGIASGWKKFIMSSKTPTPRRSAEPHTDRQAERRRLLLKEKIATLEADLARAQESLAQARESNANLMVDFKLQLREIHEKDALIEELQTATKLDRPTNTGDVQRLEALQAELAQAVEEKDSLKTSLEARLEEIREKDKVIGALQAEQEDDPKTVAQAASSVPERKLKAREEYLMMYTGPRAPQPAPPPAPITESKVPSKRKITDTGEGRVVKPYKGPTLSDPTEQTFGERMVD